MYKFTILILTIAALVTAQDPNQKALDQFYQIPGKKVNEKGKKIKDVNANVSGECAAAVIKEGYNIGSWNSKTKICSIMDAQKNPPNVLSVQFRNTGISKVDYSLASYSESSVPNDFSPKSAKAIQDLKCDILSLETIEGSSKYYCVNFIKDNDSLMLLKGLPVKNEDGRPGGK